MNGKGLKGTIVHWQYLAVTKKNRAVNMLSD